MLSAGVVIQLMLPGATQLPDDSGVAPRRPRAPAAAMVPDYPAVLRAPIFSPDRAPGEASGTGDDGTAAAGSLQVLGVAASGRTASAIVRTPDGASHVLTPGQALQGWRLLSVLPSAAVVSGPGGRVVLQVGAPAAKPATASAATAPTSPASPEPPP